MSLKQSNLKRNRLTTNVEDDINDATMALAEQENLSTSELLRAILLSELKRLGLLPDSTIARLAGVRD